MLVGKKLSTLYFSRDSIKQASCNKYIVYPHLLTLQNAKR